MSFSAPISEESRTIFCSITSMQDRRSEGAGDNCLGDSLAGSCETCAVDFSAPQLMQVVLSPNLIIMLPHFSHGSPVNVPPFTSREAACLILAESSEVIWYTLAAMSNFFFAHRKRDTIKLYTRHCEKSDTRWRLSVKNEV